MIKNPKSKILKNKFSGGFTLLELTFVIAIFGIMAMIVMSGFQNFSKNITFDNLTQDIAATIVQAQKASISGLRNGLVSSGETAPSYGVYFSSYNISGGGTPPPNVVFKYFADLDHDGKFLTSSSCTGALALSSNECISSTRITTGEYVSSIADMDTSAGSLVYHNAGTSEDSNIVFTRPFPDAVLNTCSHTSTTTCYTSAQYALIELTSPAAGNIKKTIIVSNLGRVQIYNNSICNAANSINPGSAGTCL